MSIFFILEEDKTASPRAIITMRQVESVRMFDLFLCVPNSESIEKHFVAKKKYLGFAQHILTAQKARRRRCLRRMVAIDYFMRVCDEQIVEINNQRNVGKDRLKDGRKDW